MLDSAESGFAANPMPLAKIPLIDLRGHTPLDLLFLFRSRARTLAAAALGMVKPPFSLILPGVERASRRWLERSKNPYFGEIRLIANAVGVPGAYTLNLCPEWFCTSGVWAGEHGPLLRRVLDWPITGLGESVVVAHQSGKAGDFFNVTWPGFSGIVQAMAPKRFAAAINQAPMRRHNAGLLGDWLLGRLSAGRRHAMPPAHLLRHIFETARDYTAAKSLLCGIPLAVPTIFTLAGTRPGEGCVVERTEEDYAVRELSGGQVCAANQFESPLNDAGQGWRPRPIDSPGRYACAAAIKGTAPGFAWFTPPIANPNSRLVMTANAASGTLAAMGMAGPEPVTQTFDLAA